MLAFGKKTVYNFTKYNPSKGVPFDALFILKLPTAFTLDCTREKMSKFKIYTEANFVRLRVILIL